MSSSLRSYFNRWNKLNMYMYYSSIIATIFGRIFLRSSPNSPPSHARKKELKEEARRTFVSKFLQWPISYFNTIKGHWKIIWKNITWIWLKNQMSLNKFWFFFWHCPVLFHFTVERKTTDSIKISSFFFAFQT